MSELERKLSDIIYTAICEIESDFDGKLTIKDIYEILIKVRDVNYDCDKALEVAIEDLI